MEKRGRILSFRVVPGIWLSGLVAEMRPPSLSCTLETLLNDRRYLNSRQPISSAEAMKVLFLPKSGVQLFHELLTSETSRDALRFYRPIETVCGVEIGMASLGSALTLAADLRWYVKRYMRGVLFEIAPGIYCSQRLAREVYFDRSVTLGDSWEFRLIFRMRGGQVVREEQVLPGAVRPCSGTTESPEIEVWCTEDEFHCGISGPGEDESSGEEGEESP
jgi:hypothetical protein